MIILNLKIGRKILPGFIFIIPLLFASGIVFAKYPEPQWKWGKGQPVIIFSKNVKRIENLGLKLEWMGEQSGLVLLKRDEFSLLGELGLSYQIITKNDAWRILTKGERQEYPDIVWLDYPSYGSQGENITVSPHFIAQVPLGVNIVSVIIYRRTTEGDWNFEYICSQDIEVSTPVVDTTISFSYSLPDSFFYVYEYWVGVGYSYSGSDYYSWFSYYINMPPVQVHQKVAMIVDEDVYDNIESDLLQYKTDVESNFDAEIHLDTISPGVTPESLRVYLQNLYNNYNFTGAILVGLLPYAMWEPVWGEPPFPIPYFYEDLDGEFIDSGGDGYYECHKWGDNPEPEIWVFWMRPPQNDPLALSPFLQKCHSYYELNLHIPMQAFECINYDWRGAAKPLYINLSHIYNEAVDTIGGHGWGGDGRVSGQEYLDYLSTYGAEMTHIWCHSGSDVHCFDESPWVYWDDIRDIQPGSWFYLLWACHGANFDDYPSNNLAINYCMGASSGLASLGVVRSIGTGNAQESFFNSLAYGKSLGEAYMDYMSYNYDSTWVKIWHGSSVSPDSFVWDFCFIGNPFVKFPGTLAGPPAPPKDLTASPGYFEVDLQWTANYETDIAGYNVYRSETSGGVYEKLNLSPISDTIYNDTTVGSNWYYYVATAVDTQDLESNYSLEISVRPITLDQGILVVDETRDGTGVPGSPNDAQVDSFYNAILSGYTFTEWDVDSLGTPSINELGPYSPVIWHGDDYASQKLSSAIPEIKKYLDVGGNLWLSGWKPILAIMGSGIYPFTFVSGDFPYDYLKLLNANESTSNDFLSAQGDLGYTHVSIDSTKIPSSWNGKMKYIDIFEPYDAEVIYSFNSASSDTSFQDKPCGIRYLGENYRVVFFGFPIYFMKEDEATLLAQKVLSDLQAGVSEETSSPTTFGLHQNHPNPFRTTTTISYQVGDEGQKRESSVSLKIYNITGRLVKTLIDSHQSPGYYKIRWDGRDKNDNILPAGIYFCSFSSVNSCFTIKIVKIK